MLPTRHAFGALLMEQGRVEQAASLYRADLGLDQTLPRARQHPNNVWALHGLEECLLRLGREPEAECSRSSSPQPLRRPTYRSRRLAFVGGSADRREGIKGASRAVSDRQKLSCCQYFHLADDVTPIFLLNYTSTLRAAQVKENGSKILR